MDSGTTLPGGDQLDLGGFRNLIHQRNLESEMILRFDLDLEEHELPCYDEYLAGRWEMGNFEDDDAEPFDAIERVHTVWVEIALQWSRLIDAPVVSRYSVGLNGEFFAEITCSLDGRNPLLSKINLEHDILLNF